MATGPQIRSTLAQMVVPKDTALVLVDMCNDFVDPRGKTATLANRPLDHARSVIPAQQRLLAAARAADVDVVHIIHSTLPDHGSDSGPWLEARSRATFSVPDICLEGSWGQEVIEELAPESGEQVVRKHRYSGFAGTDLDLILRSGGKSTVVIAGVSTNVCVESTARDAFSLDYYVVIPEDACASWSRELHQASIESAGHRYATVTAVDEIARLWA
jgi:ureidoacrylate peracid hydrolase